MIWKAKYNGFSVYPCTVVADRYDGTYSGGKWVAFYGDASDLPKEIGGGDPDEEMFWCDGGDHEKYSLGVGETPDSAVLDLINNMKLFHL